MSRTCRICSDDRVQVIDDALAVGRSARSLAVEFDLPPESLKRHVRNHLVTGVASVSAVGSSSSDPDALDELVAALRERALGGTNSGLAREYRLALNAQTERTAERPAYDVLADPDWVRLQAILTDALAPFPEARQAVADALHEALR